MDGPPKAKTEKLMALTLCGEGLPHDLCKEAVPWVGPWVVSGHVQHYLVRHLLHLDL
jgi:hypothetical protein